MDRKEKIDLIAQDLPMIREIQSPELAEQVADVWLLTLKLSTWDNIGDMPFKDGAPARTLKEHVNACAEAALAVSRIFKKYHGLELDEDLLLSFVLIHDVDKALKYASDGQGGVVISEEGKKIQHGVMSAMIARDCGFSTEMLHLLLTHTPVQKMEPACPEGVMFRFLDNCDWEMVCRYCIPKDKERNDWVEL